MGTVEEIMGLIIAAMEKGLCIDFFYNDFHRVVEPYGLGYSSKGDVLLQGYQIWGDSLRGKEVGMKLFRVDKIMDPMIEKITIEIGKEEYDPNWVWMAEVLKQM